MATDKIIPQQYPAAYARTQLESVSSLDIDSTPFVQRLSVIVCSIGAVSQTVETLEKLIAAGMCVARLNLSHEGQWYHKTTIENVRAAALKQGVPIAIAMDTKGPEIRTGILKEGETAELQLVQGKTIKVTVDEEFKTACDENNLWVDYKNIVNVLVPGKRILIDEGKLSLVVKDKGVVDLKCEVEYGGILRSRKACVLPGTHVDLPTLSEKDREDALFCVDNAVDAIFMSFTRSAENVHALRNILGEKGKRIKIYAVIENYEAVKKFGEILDASDGIVIGRGDLGLHISAPKVFLAQKMMIGRCQRAGKPVIVASHLLNSMVKKSRPTRAEVSDVANAILDGADGVLLTSETDKGAYPVASVDILCRICKEAEAATYHRQMFEELRMLTPKPTDATKSTAMATVAASIDTQAAAIIVLTTSGRSAHCMSSYRPRCPIFAVTRDEATARQLRFLRGVIAIYYPVAKASTWEQDVENRIQMALKIAEQKDVIRISNPVILVHGSSGESGNTDTMRIIYYGRK